jgi:hypothetical protein
MNIKKWTMLFLSLCVLLPTETSLAQKDEAVTDKMETMPMEAVISSPEKLEGKEFSTKGYIYEIENGYIIYYSLQDYLYDTTENSILVECDKTLVQQDLSDGEILTGLCIKNLRRENGRLRGDLYMDTYNENNLVSIPRKESEDEKNVSVYRMFGNPWQYNGAHVRFEAQLGYDTYEFENIESMIFRADSTKDGMLEQRAAQYNLDAYEMIGIAKVERVRVYLSGKIYVFRYGGYYNMSELTDFEYHEKVVQNLDKYVEDYRKKMEEWRNR